MFAEDNINTEHYRMSVVTNLEALWKLPKQLEHDITRVHFRSDHKVQSAAVSTYNCGW